MFDILDRSRRRPGDIKPVETIVAGADGFVIASSDPVRVPSQARVPERYLQALGLDGKMAIANGTSQAYVRREVIYEKRSVGSIYAGLDIAPLLAERREVLWTLILTNAGLTLLLAGAAWLVVGRMMQPVRVLTRYLERSQTGEVRRSLTLFWRAPAATTGSRSKPTIGSRRHWPNARRLAPNLPRRNDLRASAGWLPAWRMRSTTRWAACSTPSTP